MIHAVLVLPALGEYRTIAFVAEPLERRDFQHSGIDVLFEVIVVAAIDAVG